MSSSAAPPKLPNFPPLKFNPPKPERLVLDNGLVVYLLEDHELPLVKVDLVFKGGTQYEPPDKVGLGSIFGQVMTRGGSMTRSPEDIETTLEGMAASVNFTVGMENGAGSMSCRAQDFDTVFGIFVDLLTHPLFRKDQLELAKSKSQEALRRMNDEPEEVARREFRRVMYGSFHPYARIPSPASIARITARDLEDLHRQWIRPNGSWIAISGDFPKDVMRSRLQAAFQAWERSDATFPPMPPGVSRPGRNVYYVQRPISQTQIRIGNLGLARHDPDHFAWEVFNELWGGSAVSRLFRTVRTQQGLAYAVGSAFSEYDQPGLIVAVCQTRGSQTMAAIQAILDVTRGIRHAPFDASELTWAKEAIRNRFVANFTSSAQIASQVMGFEYFGFPKDYLDTYPDRIAEVRAADLARVGRTYLHPDTGTILVVGDLSTFDKPLSRLGKPQEIKLEDYAHENP